MSDIDTNLNVSPYFDDYQSNTNYHRILFKPAVPVQARELTSLQTMLQQQVAKFGDNILQEGTIVSGCAFRRMTKAYIKVMDTHGGSNTSTFNISNYSNGYLRDEQSNLIMQVIDTVTGFEINNPDMNAFFGSYLNTGEKTVDGVLEDHKTLSEGSQISFYPANGQISNTFTINSGGTLYTNGDLLIFTSTRGANAQATVVTDSDGVITSVDLTNAGVEYRLDDVPVITVSTSTGDGANIVAAINSTAHFTVPNSSFRVDRTDGHFLIDPDVHGALKIPAAEYRANTAKYPNAVRTLDTVDKPSGSTERIFVSEGIIFQKGHFIDVAAQAINVDKFNLNPDKISVGFTVEESIVNSSIDSSLLDNAAGFNNENAPGADRLKLVPKLTSLSQADVANTDSFFPIVQYEDGQMVRVRTDTQFDSIGSEMAKRTAEESGDYVVRPFPVKVVDDTANTNFDRVVVGAGKGYVEGFRIETLNNTFIPIKKGIDTANIDTASISQDFGNYIEVNELVGTFDFNTGAEIFLMDTPGNRISECPAGTDPTVPTTNTATTVTATSPAYDKNMGGFVVMERSDEFGADAGDNIIIEDAGTDGSGLNRANNVILDGTTGSAEIIGKARLRGWRLDQGTHGQSACRYRVYLFDVRMNQGKQFNDVRALSYFSGSNAGVGFADVVLNDNDRAVLKETQKRNMLSRLGHKGIKTLNHKADDVAQYTYSTIAQVTANTTGFATITLTGNQVFNYTGSSTLSDTDENDFIIVANNNQAQTVALTGTVTVTAGQSNVVGSSTTFLNDYQVGDTIVVGSASSSIPANSTQIITGITNATLLEVKEDFGSTLSANTHARKFPTDRAISLTGNAQSNIVVSSDQKSVTINMSRGKEMNAALPLIVKYNATRRQSQQKNKTLSANVYVKIDCSNNDANSVGPWCLGSADVHKIQAIYVAHGNSTVAGSFTDIETAANSSAGVRTNAFSLERGGQDGFYNLSKLRLKTSGTRTVFANGGSAELGTITSNTKILVKMQHFYVGGTAETGYFSVDSYPIDDTTATLPNDKIRTEDVPRYTSKLDGETYDLRNVIDFRPHCANTANNGSGTGTSLANTAAKATTNPATTVSFSGEQYWAAIGKSMIADYQVYLPRVDRVVLNKEGHIRVVPGEPDFNPVGPSKQHAGMNLGTVIVPQFPSLPPKEAMEAGRPDTTYQVSLKQPRGFTMKDIGQIKSEVRKLQYYSSLNLLEKNTMDLNVPSSSNVALNRFKNGILVDNFQDQSIAAINDREFKASFEMPRKIVTTKVVKNKIDITPTSGSFSNTVMTDPKGSGEGLISIDYDSTSIINQQAATKTRNLTASDTSYCGFLYLYPDYDNFMDVSTNVDKPPIQLDLTSGVESLKNAIADLPGILDAQQDVIADQTEVDHVGTSVSERTLNVVGERTSGGTNVVEYREEETTEHYNNIRTVTREHSQNQFTSEETQNTIKVGEFVTDVRFNMYIREQIIRGHVVGMKPSTRHYFTFARDNIDEFVRPMTVAEGDSVVSDNFREAGAIGDPVYANAEGEIYFEFHMPARTFFVGSNDVGITDQPSLEARFQQGNYTSHAAGVFNAFNHGIDKESVDLTTKKVEYYRDRVVTGTSATVTETPSQASTYRHYNQVVDFIADPPPVVHVVQNYAAQHYDENHDGDCCDGDGGDCDCFIAGTPVLMADGSTKNIENIQYGDLVAGKDGATNIVKATHTKTPDIPFLYGFNGHDPFVTAYHPFLTKEGWGCFEPEKFKEHRPEAYQSIVEDNGGHELVKIQENTKILFSDGNWEVVKELKIVDCNPDMDVYNLTVDGDRTFTVFNYIVHNKDDPVAQTFFVKSGQGIGGMFVTGVDIYFNTKDANKGVVLEVRKTEGGKPTAFKLPYSSVHKKSSEVNVSQDGSTATTFTFDAPVFLKNGEQYCIILIPDANNPNYNVWVRELGQPDTLTGKQITTGGFEGTLWVTTSDGPGQWDPVLSESLKFNLRRAEFKHGSGTVQYENQPIEYLTLDSINGQFQQGERVFLYNNSANITGNVSFSTTSETVSGTGTTFTTDLAVGDFIALTNGTSHDVRKVSNIVSNTSLTLQGYPDFTGTTTNTRIQKTPSGTVFFYENTSTNKEMWLENSTASGTSGFQFSNNVTIIGAVSHANATVTTVDNQTISGFQNLMNQISPAGTKLTQFVQANTTTGTTANSAFPINDINHFEEEVIIKSRSNEIIDETGKSFKQTFKFDTTSQWVSPIIDDSTTSILKISNIINNDNTNEHLPGQGNADAKYISKSVTLDDGQDAEDIRVYVTATQPGDSEIEAYARIQHEMDGGNVVDKHWTKLQRVGDNAKSQPGARTQFLEHEFRMPDAPVSSALTSTATTELGNTVIATSQDESSNISAGDLLKIEHTDPNIDYQVEVVTAANSSTITVGNEVNFTNRKSILAKVTYPQVAFKDPQNEFITTYFDDQQRRFETYKVFQIKLVMLSPNSTRVPRLQDMRAIAMSV